MSQTLADSLQLCDVALRIEGPSDWMESFRRMWRGWMGGEGLEPWEVSLSRSSTVPAPQNPDAPELHFVDGVCRFWAPGSIGMIDPGLSTCHLEAHPAADMAHVAIFLRTCVALQAFDRGGLLFHSAGVVHRGHGYALFGLSGSGKTTAARLSRGDVVINDDLILIKADETGWQMWGTPFGADWPPQPRSTGLRALLRLVQDQEARLRDLGPGAALGELVASSPVINSDPTRLPALLSRCQVLLEHVPLRALHFRKDHTFWEVIDAEFG